jgi:hypothetical protein
MTKFETAGLGWVAVGLALVTACGSEGQGADVGAGSAGEAASAGQTGGGGGDVAAEAGSPSAVAGAGHTEGGGPQHGGEHAGRAGAGGDSSNAGASAGDAGTNGDAGADGHAGTGAGNAGGEAGATASDGMGGEAGATASAGLGGEAGAPAVGGTTGAAAAAGVSGANGGEDAGGAGGADGDAPPIEREQTGGAPRAIATDATHVYVGVGPRVVVHRVVRGDVFPGGLPFIAETAPFEGNVSAVLVDGERAFVAEHDTSRGAVHVLDITDPSRPLIGDRIVLAETDSRPCALAADGDTLYVADERRGVFEIDLAASEGPRVVDWLDLDVPPNQLWLEGATLYFARSGQTELSFGALERQGLTLLGASTTLSMASRRAAFVAPNLLVSHGSFGTSVARVDDLNTPPSTVLALPNLAGTGIVIPGPQLAWITGSDGIHTLDLADPNEVHDGNAFPLPSGRAVASARADWLLTTLADDGETTLWATDDPLAPRPFVRAITATPCANCGAFALHDDAPVIPRADATRLWLSELQPGNLRPLHVTATNAEAAAPEDVTLHGDVVAIADRNFGLRLFALDALPRALGSFARPASSVVALSDTRAFLGGTGLTVVDLENPEAPSHEATLSTSMLVRDLQTHGSLLFVAEDTPGQGALRIFDTSDSTFDEVGNYAGCARPASVTVEAGLAIVACGDHFELIDVSVPEEPAHVTTFTTSGRAQHAALRDGAAYLADAERIRVVDVTSGAELASIAAKGVVHVEVSRAGRVVASLGAGGVRQWQLSSPEQRSSGE